MSPTTEFEEPEPMSKAVPVLDVSCAIVGTATVDSEGLVSILLKSGSITQKLVFKLP